MFSARSIETIDFLSMPDVADYIKTLRRNPSVSPAQTMTYDSEQNEDKVALVPASCIFLNLPVEIRLQIYRYLAPNAVKSPYRDDGRPCCPSILQTNRTIYKEAIGEWYSLVPHKAFIDSGYRNPAEPSGQLDPGYLQLFGQCTSRFQADNIPSVFRAIKSLDLSIRLKVVRLQGLRPPVAPNHASKHLDIDQLLQACFPPQSTDLGNLQRLRLRLGTMYHFFTAYKGQPDELKQALHSNLHAIRNLRGLVHLSTEVHISHVVEDMLCLRDLTSPLLPWKKEYIAILRAYARDLRKYVNNTAVVISP